MHAWTHVAKFNRVWSSQPFEINFAPLVNQILNETREKARAYLWWMNETWIINTAMVRKNDQILGGLESEVCSWRTIMTLIGGLVALEWKMGMEKKKKKREKFLQEDRAKRSPFLSRGNPPPSLSLRISRKRNRSGVRRRCPFPLAMTLFLQRPLYLTDREE